MQLYRDKIGQSFYFQVTGSTTGTIRGTGVYTHDSSLAVAAVHAGVLRAGQKGFVKVTMVRGQKRYLGSTKNGVTSLPFEKGEASYRIQRVDPWVVVKFTEIKFLPNPSTLTTYRGKVGKTYYFQVIGTTNGTIWGTGPYTDDSLLSTAAVHAGLLGKGQKAILKVTILAGQNAYQGSTQNGITSHPYGPWGGSYSIELVKRK
jgi:hypothetical protein